MTDAILQAYREVEQAIARYNKVLEEHVTTLRASESADTRKLERMMQGAKAMRDSSMIYLSYAKFIASGMPESEDLIEENLQG